MAETDPYKLIDDTYANALAQIQSKRGAGELQRAQNEQALQNTLTETNRGYNISYKNATNPFGYNAEQRGVMGTGVSDYFKNAALGNMMQGQAKAQGTWQSGMNDLATRFNNFLLDLATQESGALSTKTNSYLSQQQADAAAAAEAAQLAEQQRQFDLSYALDQANAAASGGGSGGGVDLEKTIATETPAERAARLNRSTNSGGVRQSPTQPTTYSGSQIRSNSFYPSAPTTQSAAQKAANQATTAARGVGVKQYVPRSSVR